LAILNDRLHEQQEKNSLYALFFLARRTNVLYIMCMEITTRQQEILSFIGSFQDREGFPPSLREICKGLGLVSAGSLLKHMRVLEKEGYLACVPGKKRAWKLTFQPSRVCIPLIGQIAAGTPILAVENKEDDLPVDPIHFGTHEAFALRVRGDSMKDESIRDGDLAIVKPQVEAESGDIVAVLIEGIESEATLKIFRKNNGDIELHPANPSYAIQRFTGPDRAKVKILGKLVGVIRRPRL
jgi:repressor LexA